MKRADWRCFAPAAVVAAVSACGAPSRSSETIESASLTFQTDPGMDFSGNSARICGSRTPPADNKYRSSNNLNTALGVPLADGTTASNDGPGGTPDDEDCPCFQFNADGTLSGFFEDTTPSPKSVVTPLPTAAGSTSGEIANLAATPDLSSSGKKGLWTFEYQIFSDDRCGGNGGALLNGPGNPNNFACFAPGDIVAMANPNATVGEALNPGPNNNAVICTTINAQKSFDFTSCVQACVVPAEGGGFEPSGTSPVRPPEPQGANFNCNGAATPAELNAFECGCTLEWGQDGPDTCNCGASGPTGAVGGSALDPMTGDAIGQCTFQNVGAANAVAGAKCAIVCPVP